MIVSLIAAIGGVVCGLLTFWSLRQYKVNWVTTTLQASAWFLLAAFSFEGVFRYGL